MFVGKPAMLLDAIYRELDELYEYLVEQSGETLVESDSEAVAQIKARLATLQSERRAALVKVRERFPEFDRLTQPKPTEATAVATHLHPDEVLLSLLPTAARTYQWLVSGGGTTFAASDITELRVRGWVGELRKTLDVAGQTPPPPIDADAAYQLYRTLIAPLRAKANGRSEWIIAGGGVLGQLPYAALLTHPGKPENYTAAAWLVNDMSLTAVPSASAWIALRYVVPPKGDKEPLIAFADPSFGSSPHAEAATLVRKLALVRHTTAGAPASDGSMPALAPSGGIQLNEIPALPETRDEVLAIAVSVGAESNKIGRFETGAHEDAVCMMCNDMS